MGCINRDENAVNNMVKIVKTYIEKKERPEKYRREYKFTDEKKDDNLSNIITDVKCSSSS
jgi:predicted transcriptional regulator YheO